jgi:hypothetical protein
VAPRTHRSSCSRAPVALLSLNPSLRTNEAALGAAFADERRRARYGEGDSTGWRLSRKWARTKDAGYAYWGRRLRDLREEVYPDRDEASGPETLARQILLVQFFPYASYKARAVRRVGSLPSQQYGFHLERRAIGEHRLIVILRSGRRRARRSACAACAAATAPAGPVHPQAEASDRRRFRAYHGQPSSVGDRSGVAITFGDGVRGVTEPGAKRAGRHGFCEQLANQTPAQARGRLPRRA